MSVVHLATTVLLSSALCLASGQSAAGTQSWQYQLHSDGGAWEKDLSYMFGPAKNQGTAQRCQVFAAVALYEAAAYERNEREHAIFSEAKAADSNAHLHGNWSKSGDSIAWSIWQYVDHLADGRGVRSDGGTPQRFAEGFEGLRLRHENRGGPTLDKITELIKGCLAGKCPVAVTLRIDRDVWKKAVISHHSLGNINDSAHAVVIVGAGKLRLGKSTELVFKFRNSWGNQWGDNGYGYITFTAFKKSVVRGGDHAMIIAEDIPGVSPNGDSCLRTNEL